MNIRYDDMRIDRSLIKEYSMELENCLERIQGLNDIKFLLDEFEEAFSKYIGTDYSISVNSGSDALLLSLLAVGVNKKHSVIIPDLTFPAVAHSVIYAEAEPILVDISKDDLEIDVNLIEDSIRDDTKAIIIPHMFGRCCDIDSIRKIAKRNNLYLIEDVCQAESSEFHGKKLGSYGDLACFSFSYYKPLSSCGGGGGMVCFNDSRFKMIEEYMTVYKDNELLLNTRQRFARMYLLDLISIRVKFKYLREIIKSRLRIKNKYENAFKDFDKIKFIKDNNTVNSVPQNFVIFSKEKDKLEKMLRQSGIVTQSSYVPLHLMKMFEKFSKSSNFKNSDYYYKRAIHLPLFSFMKDNEADYVIEQINNFYG